MRARPLLVLTLLAAAQGAPAAAQTPPPSTTPAPPPTTVPPPAIPTLPPPKTPVPPKKPAKPAIARIAAGVTAGGIDVGGLTVLQASKVIKAEATPPLTATPIVLKVADKRWKLSMARAELRVRATRTAEAALALRGPGDVELRVNHSEDAVAAFVDSVARRVYRAPRNATLRITLRKMVVRRAKRGHYLNARIARRIIDEALGDPNAKRTVRKRVSALRAETNADDLRRRYPSVITVDKANFKLRLFKQLKFSRSYGVATGLPAYPTPSGLFAIQSKQVDPVWSVPNSAWAGELQGTTVAGGTAANPLKARWMGVVGGIGIHGTGEEWTIGSRASHGCLRMRVASVKDLFERVSIGTPVLLG